MIRNKKIIELADEIYLPYLSKGGQLEKLKALYEDRQTNTAVYSHNKFK